MSFFDRFQSLLKDGLLFSMENIALVVGALLVVLAIIGLVVTMGRHKEGRKKITTKQMATIGMMAALVFAGSWIQIPLPAESRLHLGNVMCLLAGYILGPVGGGLAAGIGSTFFDFTNPIYIQTAPFTFVFKFLMAFVCGKIAYGNGAKATHVRRNVVAGIAGIVVYLVLYLTRNVLNDTYFLQQEAPIVWAQFIQRLVTSGINGVIAVVASMPLATAVRKGLDRAGIE